MKSVVNSYKDQKCEECSSENFVEQKKLAELINANKQKQTLIAKLEKQIDILQKSNTQIDILIETHQREYSELAKHEEQERMQYRNIEVSQEAEHEMNNWIQNVQKYNGLPQDAIDSLISLEYQNNGEQEICLSCYVELKQSQQCKYLPCYHMFHSQCISNHLKINRNCPACQEQVVL